MSGGRALPPRPEHREHEGRDERRRLETNQSSLPYEGCSSDARPWSAEMRVSPLSHGPSQIHPTAMPEAQMSHFTAIQRSLNHPHGVKAE